ncbi:hypothetical protein LCGC14_1017060 [marine sediment metagenome]|uniref:Uncharacterized protein n=1 Tax=marine sediment metagenome TaxID=412755 RepID=A0A0F9MYJ7_9ZZZZ
MEQPRLRQYSIDDHTITIEKEEFDELIAIKEVALKFSNAFWTAQLLVSTQEEFRELLNASQ